MLSAAQLSVALSPTLLNPCTEDQLAEFLSFMLSQSTNTIIVANQKSSTILTNDRRLAQKGALTRSKRNRYFTPRLNRAVVNQFRQKMHCVVFKSYNL